MKHASAYSLMTFLAVYACIGNPVSEDSPDFRLGSGAGATYSDSYSYKDPQPRSSAAMPFVAFAFLLAAISYAMILISWTYLVTWQNTAGFYGLYLELHRIKKTKQKTNRAKQKRLSAWKERRSTIPRVPRALRFLIALASFVDSEALTAETTILRTSNPVKPLLHHVRHAYDSIITSLPPPDTYNGYYHDNTNNDTTTTTDYYYDYTATTITAYNDTITDNTTNDKVKQFDDGLLVSLPGPQHTFQCERRDDFIQFPW